jgi:hypothetical protein
MFEIFVYGIFLIVLFYTIKKKDRQKNVCSVFQPTAVNTEAILRRKNSSLSKNSILIYVYIVYLIRARTVVTEKTVLARQRPLHGSLETVVTREGSWCEIDASQRGREPRSRETSTGEDTADSEI